MGEKYIMSLDQGTTSSRCIIFNHDGKICSISQREFPQIYPEPGWVEHNPEQIWETEYDVMQQAMTKLGINGLDIEAIGITNQRETTIIWEKSTGKPIYNAIVWQCRRTAKEVEHLKEMGYEKRIREITGLIPDAYFSGTKIQWILDNVEGARAKAERGELLFGTIDSWLIWKLTGGKVHCTDYTNASRTMIFNIHSLQWDKEMLELLHIPENMLPQVRPSSGLFGYTDAKITGASIPIMGVAGDQQAALFGQCCFNVGEVKNTYGTGCFLLMNTGEKATTSKNGLITTIAASQSNHVKYALEGSVFTAGAAVQWLRDELNIVEKASETEKLAQSVENTLGAYVIPAFTGMGAPYWKQEARGMIVGLTRGFGKAHLVRATLEAIAYQTYDILKAMEQDAKVPIETLRVDGGASANNFLLKFQADMINKKVIRPTCIETTALGAAYLAGLASGYWKNEEDIRSCQKQNEEIFVPQMTAEKREEKISGWKNAIRHMMI